MESDKPAKTESKATGSELEVVGSGSKANIKDEVDHLKKKSSKENIREELENLKDPTRTQIYKSIFRVKHEPTPRSRSLGVLTNVFLHLHPAKINRDATRFSYTWGKIGRASCRERVQVSVVGGCLTNR